MPRVSQPGISDETLPITRLDSLGNLTGHLKARVRVRVLDHMPVDIVDFARPVCDACQKMQVFLISHAVFRFTPNDSLTACECGFNLKEAYQFAFSLLITDGTDIVPVSVSDEEAVILYTNSLCSARFR